MNDQIDEDDDNGGDYELTGTKDEQFIINILLFCGECVKLGKMKPFTILHSDVKLTTLHLENSTFKSDIMNSYRSMLTALDFQESIEGLNYDKEEADDKSS
jgi:hypothetical protein